MSPPAPQVDAAPDCDAGPSFRLPSQCRWLFNPAEKNGSQSPRSWRATSPLPAASYKRAFSFIRGVCVRAAGTRTNHTLLAFAAVTLVRNDEIRRTQATRTVFASSVGKECFVFPRAPGPSPPALPRRTPPPQCLGGLIRQCVPDRVGPCSFRALSATGPGMSRLPANQEQHGSPRSDFPTSRPPS
jgi:hypothetical protein